ncbi:MAG: hypothetical protein AAGG44_10485 [Planctomycetota bacterium]
MPLREVRAALDESIALPQPVEDWIQIARESIQSFWDSRSQKMQTGWVECDFRYVAQVLICLTQSDDSEASQGQPVIVGPFVEWGSGFAVVAGLAAMFGMDSTGIESEEFIHLAAQRLHRGTAFRTQLVRGNFLPAGADELAEPSDPRVALAASIEEAYPQLERKLTDYQTVFVYAWPGEEHFLKQVFQRYAATEAVLLLYRGPYHLEIYRKT